MKTITVGPGSVGWIVDGDLGGYPMSFLSGAKAESTAMRLAAALAHGEGSARVVVRDRSGRVVGSTLTDQIGRRIRIET